MKKHEILTHLEALFTGQVLTISQVINTAFDAGFAEADRTRAQREQGEKLKEAVLGRGAHGGNQ